MNTLHRWPTLAAVLLTLATTARAVDDTVEFNRDIRAILSDNCFACHGPDRNQRKAKLRLDVAETNPGEHGGLTTVVSGKPEESELYLRITAAEDGERKRMPPAKFGKKLTHRQTELIRKWIAQGGNYQKHWSLLVPKRVAPPKVSDEMWPINPVDRFILARLDREKQKPSPEADRRTLLRRLSFDLVGLPPTPEEVEAFVSDKSPDAYEKVVDRLLASKHYGERMAQSWLDLVRFADTGGYHSDNHRDITLFRDWVINAFNANEPFDQFTREQLAGDLLPRPTTEQKIASGYNRLLQTTEEGGAQAREYTAKYQADRVRNAAVVWLGLTMGCAECHDHKFDPVVTREFYQFAAFFADVQEKAVGRQDQVKMPTAEQEAELKRLEAQLTELQKKLAAPSPQADAEQPKWEMGLKQPEIRKLPKPVQEALLVEPARRNPGQKLTIAAHYRTIAPALEPIRKQITELQKYRAEVDKQIPTTLITIATTPRVVRVLPRGNWLDDSGEIVQPAVPASLGTVAPDGKRATRLDLANWLVSADNPLVARVFVNRIWKLLFGQGLVKTMEDFGSQGAAPTHPELLDWLAVDFRESGWDVKRLVKTLVLTSTYRQSSLAGEELRQRDPYNVLLARQARFRIDAEMVRDNALSVSGLLNRRIGGPSVKPYQPAGYWAMLNFPRRTYVADKGEDQYRRGLYTYWQRTFPHPSLVAFDAPSREECTADRPRSNTPLQALVLLNDPTYVEAAKALAERLLRGGKSVEERVRFAYRQVLQRQPTAEELKVILPLAAAHLEQYRKDTKAAAALLTVGERPAPKDVDVAEMAAWVSVSRVLLNLHETITRN